MKSKFILMLLFFFSGVAAMAADPLAYADVAGKTMLLDHFPIIVFSETKAFENMFQFVAGFAHEFSLGGDLFLLGSLGMGVSIVFGVYRAFIKYSIGGAALEIIFPVFAAILLIAPTQSVSIYDGRKAQSVDVKIVNGVPWFIATTASLTSVGSAYFIILADNLSSVIGGAESAGFGVQGLGAPEAFALKAIQKARFDNNVTIAIDSAIKECLIPNGANSSTFDSLGEYIDGSQKYNSFEAMRMYGSNIGMNSTIMSDGVDCKTFLEDKFSSTAENAATAKIEAAILGHLTFLEIEKLGALVATTMGMTNNSHYNPNDGYSEQLGNFIGYLKNYAFTGALAGSIINARADVAGGGNALAIVAETTARATMGNLQVSGIGNWRAMGELVPLAHSFLLSIIYAASILMGFVVLWGGYAKGMATLKEFFTGLVAFESVKIAFVLANNAVLFYSQENAVSMLAGNSTSSDYLSLNPTAIPYIAQHLEFMANMAGMAGALGLATMLFIPGIIFGGKVASAMGILGNTGSMVQNKSPQDTASVIGEHNALEEQHKKIAGDARMRSELERMGVHVGANTDVGAVYGEYQAGMDRSANNLAAAAMYRNMDERYGGVQAQAMQAGGSLIGTGRQVQSTGTSMSDIQSMGEGMGAKSFGMNMEAYKADKDAGVLNANNTLSEAAKAGQRANSIKSAGALIGAGESGMSDADILNSAKANTIDSMRSEINKGKELIDKFGPGLNRQPTADQLKEQKGYEAEIEKATAAAANHYQRAKTAVGEEAQSGYKELGDKAKARADKARENLRESKAASMSHSSMVDAEQTKAIQSRTGSAAGVIDNLGKDSGIYSKMASMSEMSSAQSAMQKIGAFGGVGGAVAADAISAAQSATTQKAGIQALGDVHGGGKDMLAAMKQGGEAAAEAIAKAMKSFGDVGYQSAHQSLEGQVGSAKGYKETRAAKGDDYQAKLGESSVKSQAAQGLEAIRAAGGINKLATQAGVKSYSDTNALRATIKTAGGAAGYIGMNQTLAVGNTQGQLAEINQANKDFGSYGNYKATAARGSVDVAQATLDGEVAGGAQNKNGSYTAAGKGAISTQKAKDTAGSIMGAGVLGKKGAESQNESLKKNSNLDDKSLISQGLAEIDKATGKVVATTGLSRAAALGRMMGGDQFGIKGASVVGMDGNIQKVSMATIVNKDTGEAVTNINSVATGTAFNTNAQGKLEQSIDKAKISQLGSAISSKDGVLAIAANAGGSMASALGADQKVGEIASMGAVGALTGYFANSTLGNPVGKMLKKGDSDGFKTTSGSTNSSTSESKDISDQHSDSKADSNEKHNTPPNENSTGKNPSSSNNYTPDGKVSQGAKRGLKAGGAVGVVASLADAYATGNMDNIVKNVKEWGGKIADGNIVGKDGALSDVESILTGRSSLDTARGQFAQGQVAGGFGTLAKGMAQQAINGVGEMGEMGIAAMATVIGNKSYSENRKSDYIPNATFADTAPAKGISPIAQAQQQHYADTANFAESVRHTGSYPIMKQAIADNPIHPAMAANTTQTAAAQTFVNTIAAQNSSNSGVKMTASDIEQSYKTTHAASTSASYIREVSRSMEEMVSSMAQLNGYFSGLQDKAEGKINKG